MIDLFQFSPSREGGQMEKRSYLMSLLISILALA